MPSLRAISIFCAIVFFFLLILIRPGDSSDSYFSSLHSKSDRLINATLPIPSGIWSALKLQPPPKPPNFWTTRDGIFLPTSTLRSRNNKYGLTISRQGELRIRRHFKDTNEPPKLIWWTNNHFQWPGEYWAQVFDDGIFSSLYREHPGGPVFHAFSSTSFPECRVGVQDGETPTLLLTDEGALELHNFAGIERNSSKGETMGSRKMCTLFDGDQDASEDMGRLAVILTGNLRSFKDTCKSTNQKILDAWPGKGGVDFLIATKDAEVYGYDESHTAIPWEKVREDLHACFGNNLKEIEVNNHTGTTFPSPSMQGGHCNATDEIIPLDRQINIFHAHFLGYQLLLRYMIQNAINYNYILKLRPDHIIWGDAIPKFYPLASNQIVFMPPYFDMPVWATTHLDHSQLVATDQAAWGPLLPMSNWLSIYSSFVSVVKAGARYGPCYGPEEPCIDSGHAEKYPCFVEGLSGYWPTLHGVKFKVDWRWKIDILREEGKRAQVWRTPWNATQGSKLVENGRE